MKIFIACEFSGAVRDAFSKAGHNATSCDLIPSETPGNHIIGNCLDYLDDDYDMLIAHPPCTYLTNCGVRYLHTQKDRWGKMLDAKEFFMALYNCDIPKICIENPVPHSYALLPPYTQIIQPYYFGDAYKKRTCLWLKNLEPLKPTNIVKVLPYVSEWVGTVKRTAKDRSRTFPGIANAMAQQWGC